VEVHEIVDVPAQSTPALTERGEVHVVLEDDRGAELPPYLVQQPLSRPAGKVMREQRMSGRTEHAGAPDGRHRHATPPDAR
jgi:hypothetical protein